MNPCSLSYDSHGNMSSSIAPSYTTSSSNNARLSSWCLHNATIVDDNARSPRKTLSSTVECIPPLIPLLKTMSYSYKPHNEWNVIPDSSGSSPKDYPKGNLDRYKVDPS